MTLNRTTQQSTIGKFTLLSSNCLIVIILSVILQNADLLAFIMLNVILLTFKMLNINEDATAFDRMTLNRTTQQSTIGKFMLPSSSCLIVIILSVILQNADLLAFIMLNVILLTFKMLNENKDATAFDRMALNRTTQKVQLANLRCCHLTV
jgi:uncharacterized membrane protein